MQEQAEWTGECPPPPEFGGESDHPGDLRGQRKSKKGKSNSVNDNVALGTMNMNNE
jgi:hypothetical protein